MPFFFCFTISLISLLGNYILKIYDSWIVYERSNILSEYFNEPVHKDIHWIQHVKKGHIWNFKYLI